MPVQKRLAVGETAEIRCTLVREGEYADARYTIRYFQPDGKGELRMDDGTVFLPNDRYPLERFSFRLYYTSRSDDQQTIDVYIEYKRALRSRTTAIRAAKSNSYKRTSVPGRNRAFLI